MRRRSGPTRPAGPVVQRANRRGSGSPTSQVPELAEEHARAALRDEMDVIEEVTDRVDVAEFLDHDASTSHPKDAVATTRREGIIGPRELDYTESSRVAELEEGRFVVATTTKRTADRVRATEELADSTVDGVRPARPRCRTRTRRIAAREGRRCPARRDPS
ncbi:hypothetical protein C8039_15345 [Halogeometricum sp. wsp3]|nr:hypothetical protein C8039_15345 [Halogeometricum sp. wsp3]